MGWRLSSWLVLVRLFQLLGSFIPGAMNGWLLYYIYTNHLGLANTMVVLEILVAIIFVYTSLSLLVIHTHLRSRRTAWLVCSICFDVILCFVDVAIVSVLAFTGVPSNCAGLTRSKMKKGDNFSLPAHGYTTIRFSNEQDGHRGELDKYCGMEQGFYFVAIAMILSYIITIVLSVIRICNINMVPKGDVDYMLEERENMIKLELKLQDQETLAQSPTTPVSSNTPAVFVAPDNHSNNARDLEAALAVPTTTSMPRARPSFSRPMLAPPTALAAAGGGPSYQSHPRRPPHFAVSPVSPLSSVSPVSPLSPTEEASAATTTTLPVEAGFILSSTEMHANLAMITDGSRYSPQQINNNNNNNNNNSNNNNGHNQLPPYSPGNHRRMNGHADESNDIRLSEYVKGATRAQDMKDGGGY
ncbi:hypothetical protein VSDG_01214 [Cytospora chrysosperma]|uniref:Uncharacterized protein n=1 Tax=Cytospora chrysosperma TaxID=252740 RepID=A0A423WII1_CYTCH|nr:hypothetical protein VSDG_01214 [Valsa sordida]